MIKPADGKTYSDVHKQIYKIGWKTAGREDVYYSNDASSILATGFTLGSARDQTGKLFATGVERVVIKTKPEARRHIIFYMRMQKLRRQN